MLTSCVAGPLEHFEADPDPRYYLLMDPDPGLHKFWNCRKKK